MQAKSERVTRKKVGEEVVSVFVKQAIMAGATIEQLESETGCPRAELTRLLKRIEQLDQLLRE